MPIPGKGPQGAHSLLEGTAGTPHPLWELMAFQKGKVEVWWEGSLVWCRHLPGFWAGCSPLRPLLPSEGQCSPGRVVSQLRKALCGWVAVDRPTWEEEA